MTLRTRSSLFVVLASLLASLALAAWASAQAPTPTRFMEQRHEEVNRILRQSADNDAARQRRSQRLGEILNGLLDYQELSRRSLGEHWERRSPQEREQFVQLLQRLVERNYEGNLERILEFEVRYDGEERRGDLWVVRTSARSRSQRRQPPVQIEYTVRADGNGYKVVDVATDGVSMVGNYRSQFGRIISRDGWGELIARMQRRLEGGSEEG